MRTYWRARTARVVIAVVAAATAVFGIAAPANAAPPQIAGFPSDLPVTPRTEFELPFQIINDLAEGNVEYTVDYDHSMFQCLERCGGTVLLGTDNVYAVRMVTVVGRFFADDTTSPVTLSAPSLPASKTANIKVAKNERVDEISGKVFDVALGDPITDAKVELTDAVGQTWEQFTDDLGVFSFKSDDAKPIAKGEIKLLVTKQNYQDYPQTIHGSVNPPFTNLRLQMIKLTTGETNPDTSGSVTQSFGAVTTSATERKEGGGLSTGSIAIIAVGGLLVVTGVVAIILLFGKRDNGGPGGKSRPGGGGRGGPAGPGRGTPPAPRRATPPGGGAGPGTGAVPRPGYGAQRPGTTTISRSPLADNPTQTRPRSPGQPPYSAAPPPGGGFGSPAPRPPQGGGQPGYGANPRSAPPAGGYGQPGYGGQGGQPGRPTSPSGFNAQAGPATGADPRRARPDGRRVDWMDD